MNLAGVLRRVPAARVAIALLPRVVMQPSRPRSCLAPLYSVSALPVLRFDRKTAPRGFQQLQVQHARYSSDSKSQQTEEEDPTYYVAALEIINDESNPNFEQKAKIALPLLRTASNRGHQNAKYTLGVLLQSGIDGEKGIQESVSLFRDLALKGHTQSQFNLGVLYLEGKGIMKSTNIALELFSLCCDEIYQAHNFIGQILVFQDKPNYEKAVEHFKKGIEAGDGQAYVSLAHMYTHGKGVEIDVKLAYKYDKIAADMGIPIAQHNIGTYHFLGKGTNQDYSEAKKYFELAANQGFTFSQVNLGNMYQQGLGCEKDLEKALHYYRLASDTNKHAESLMKAVQDQIDKQKAAST